MVTIELDCVEGYKVTQTMYGLEVYDGDNLVCELAGSFFADFEDEWGKVDEDERLDAVYEQIEVDEKIKELQIPL
jgi:hypothetical protein